MSKSWMSRCTNLRKGSYFVLKLTSETSSFQAVLLVRAQCFLHFTAKQSRVFVGRDKMPREEVTRDWVGIPGCKSLLVASSTGVIQMIKSIRDMSPCARETNGSTLLWVQQRRKLRPNHAHTHQEPNRVDSSPTDNAKEICIYVACK